MLLRTLLAAALTLAVPATASAATELGQTPPPTESCAATVFAWHTSAPYLAPAAGVITELRATAGTAGASLSVKVVRPSTATVLGTTTPLTVDTANEVAAESVRIPVRAGDALGVYVATETDCGVPGTASDTFSVAGVGADPPPGPVAGEVETGGTTFRLSIAGTFEPDADGDGFGDESQDACPADPTRSTGPCDADATLTASATPAAIEVGDVAVLDMSVLAPPGRTVRAARITATLPPGLEPLLVTPHSCVFATPFTCALGDITGTSRESTVVVRATAAGSFTVPVAATSTTPDPDPADNVATATLTVGPATGGCLVPKLKGRKKAFAKALLEAAGCRLGRVKRKTVRRGRAGRVRRQSVKAGTRVAEGTRVGITIARKRKR